MNCDIDAVAALSGGRRFLKLGANEIALLLYNYSYKLRDVSLAKWNKTTLLLLLLFISIYQQYEYKKITLRRTENWLN